MIHRQRIVHLVHVTQNELVYMHVYMCVRFKQEVFDAFLCVLRAVSKVVQRLPALAVVGPTIEH